MVAKKAPAKKVAPVAVVVIKATPKKKRIVKKATPVAVAVPAPVVAPATPQSLFTEPATDNTPVD